MKLTEPDRIFYFSKKERTFNWKSTMLNGDL